MIMMIVYGKASQQNVFTVESIIAS